MSATRRQRSGRGPTRARFGPYALFDTPTTRTQDTAHAAAGHACTDDLHVAPERARR